MSKPFILFRLQQIDNKINSARSRLDEIEIALKDDSRLRRVQEQTETISQTLQEAQKALQTAERNVQDQQAKIQQSEAILYSGKVRNPKELQDIQSEAVALKSYLIVLEDRQLDTMMIVEEAEIKHKEVSKNLKSVEAETTAKVTNLEQEKLNLLRDLDLLESERHVAIGGASPDDLKIYELLRTQKNGVAVAKVSGKNCMACGSTLTAALLQAAQSPNQLTRCASCGRILYVG
jgi:predicted  nucleic acid-binding Zn-ribbon protein